MPWCTKHDAAWCSHQDCVKADLRVRKQQQANRGEQLAMAGHPGSWTFTYELPVEVIVRVDESGEHDGDRAEVRAAALARAWLTSLSGSRFEVVSETGSPAVRGNAGDLVLERDDFEYAPEGVS